MESVTSRDGTTIAYEQTGDGPPVVLVHGTSTAHHSWDALTPHLTEEYTLVAPDRRGRGASGDGDEYDLEREIADVRAVIDAIDGKPILFGHSFGALVALEATRTAAIERLVLYEPALLVGDHRGGTDLSEQMQQHLDAGERRAAAEVFFRQVTGAENVERLPVAEAAEIAETILRESRAVDEYRLDGDLDVSVPTLLFFGEHGPEPLHDGVRKLHARLPESRVVELEDVGHVGISSAPERVASEVRAFADEA